jgi:NAD+ diphosphatase
VPHFAFAQSPLDRMANSRTNSEVLQNLMENPHARWVKIHGDGVQMQTGTLDLARLPQGGESIFLGCDDTDYPWFAVAVEASEAIAPLRGLMIDAVLPPETLSILAQARSLVHWHVSHQFCARCGAKSQMSDAGYRRHCTACNSDHFPRTDPVVIMAVCHGKRMLLGRQKPWPEGMYSALAGFLEPGETIEAGVRREVMEEVGIRLGKIDYVASQPWPFPASLMIGMIGEAIDTQLTIDENELETARWFEADEVRMMMAGTHPDKLSASRPDAIAWHLVKAALENIGG